MANIPITSMISINSDELHEKFVRSTGPGGQNVNKVSTAVQLRFDVAKSLSLPARVKANILKSGDRRLSKDGILIIIAENKRTQEANRREAVERLVHLLREAAVVRKHRKATKPTASSIKRRLDQKTKRGALKKDRSKRRDID